MAYSPNDILSRIEWCRLQRKGAVTLDEEGGWQAEEAGLIDALLGKDRTASRRNSYPSLLERYQRGLKDGQALMRLHQRYNRWPEIMEGLSQVNSILSNRLPRQRSQ